MNKNILILGHLGYVGGTLIRYLKNKYPKCNLIGYDNQYFKDDSIFENPEDLLDEEYFGDIRNFSTNIFIDENIDTVICLAAISNDPMSNNFEDVTYEINNRATFNLAERAKLAGVKSFIFASSCSVYGFSEDGGGVTETSNTNPLTPYAKSKLSVENHLRMLSGDSFKVTCLRFATACGPSDRMRLDLVLNDFVASALKNKKIEILSDGTPWRPLIDVADMARAFDWAINRDDKNAEVVNAGSYNYQIKELAALIKEQLPETEIIINNDAAPDKRSYVVNFDKFRFLAPDYFPKYTIQQTITGLIAQLKYSPIEKDFRNSNLIRLNKLITLQKTKKLDKDLKWIQK